MDKNTYLLGCDVGTHETKGILVSTKDFRPVVTAAVPHSIENPKPGFYEMDAEIWWSDFCQVVHMLLDQTGIAPEQIIAVGTDVMGCDCIPVDENCMALRKAILYGVDTRSTAQIEELLTAFGEEKILELYGHRPASDDIAPKILWVKENEPEVYARTHKFLTGSSFLTAKLTGKFTIDSYLAKACFRPIYRADGSYNEEYGPFYCSAEQMAEPTDVTAIAGTVTKAAAEASGLCAGTPVITGTGDSTSESIAGGLVTPGTLFVQFGSTMFLIYCTDTRMDAGTDDSFGGSNPFTIPGSFAVTAGTNCAGNMTKWIRDVFYRDERDAALTGGENTYSLMAEEAGEIAPGSGGLIVLPYLYGERSPIHDPNARGMIFGLTAEHDRKAINRAALEGVAYSFGSHLKLFAKHGLKPDRIVIAGGGTKNPVWMQIVADMAGMEISVSEDWQTACYGCACMAAIGCGLLKDFYELKNVMPKGRTYVPNMENHELYLRRLDLYETLYEQNKELMHQLPL